MVSNMWNELMSPSEETIQLEVEFLDQLFNIEVPKDIPFDELCFFIERFLTESPKISLDLKTISKTILDCEYYTFIVKQENALGQWMQVKNNEVLDQNQPIRVELVVDEAKRFLMTRKHLKSVFKHIESISIPEFTKVLQIKDNVNSFRQNLVTLEPKYPYSIKDDIIFLNKPFSKLELKKFSYELLDSIY